MNTYLLLAANMAANTGSHVCFKLSVAGRGVKAPPRSARRTRRFLFWQVIGNLAAFGGVIAFTVLLRGMPLHTAYPLTEGLTAIGVQLVGSMLIMKERVTPLAWVGTGLILGGVALFSI